MDVSESTWESSAVLTESESSAVLMEAAESSAVPTEAELLLTRNFSIEILEDGVQLPECLSTSEGVIYSEIHLYMHTTHFTCIS